MFITSFTVQGNYFFWVNLQGGREVVLPHNLIRCPKNFWCFHSILIGWFQRLARVQTFQQQKFKSTERDICLTSLGSKSATSALLLLVLSTIILLWILLSISYVTTSCYRRSIFALYEQTQMEDGFATKISEVRFFYWIIWYFDQKI